MTPEIAAQLKEIGREINPPATAAIYAPLHTDEPERVNVVRDLRYGDHERHVLDVWSEARSDAARPVLVFVHGGGFQRGAKTLEGAPFYDNVMRWAAEQGYVGVNINYRLAPAYRWPSGIEDLSAVVEWLQQNIAAHGGDPTKIFLWGHSAGAGHVADYLAARARNARDSRIRGAILLSGMYALGNEVSIWQAYYGDDVSTYAQRSALQHLPNAATPLLVVDAELDPPWAQQQARLLSEAFSAAGKPLGRLHLAGHSHISESYAVGTSDRSLTDPINRFIATTLGQEN